MLKRGSALTILLACLMWVPAGRLVADDDRLFWYTDYKEALQEAKKTGKPIFLEYRCEA